MKINERISYRDKKVFIGVDVHRRHYTVSCICDDELVKKCQIVAIPEQLLCLIKKYFSEAKVKVVYEAGFSGFALYRHLEQHKIDCIVVNPSSIEISSRDRVKTDKRDSLRMATQLANGRLRGITVPSKKRENQRLITRSREQLLKERTRIKNQIRFKFHQFGLFPLEFQTRLTRNQVILLLKKDLSEELRASVNLYIEIWDILDTEIKKLDKELQKQADDDPLEMVYRSACGVGAVTSRTLANELGDMSQFANEKALFSYTGLTPAEYSSGEHRRLGHISRQGNARLRRVLIECAWSAIKKDKKLNEDFVRISSKAGKKRAIVAIARKLIGRVRAAVRKGEMYELGHNSAILK